MSKEPVETGERLCSTCGAPAWQECECLPPAESGLVDELYNCPHCTEKHRDNVVGLKCDVELRDARIRELEAEVDRLRKYVEKRENTGL